jgi:hypothetical protein
VFNNMLYNIVYTISHGMYHLRQLAAQELLGRRVRSVRRAKMVSRATLVLKKS